MVKNPSTNEEDRRDASSILALGRSRGGGHGNPHQYYCLENPMDRVWLTMVHRVAKSPRVCYSPWVTSLKKQPINVSGLPCKNGYFCCGHENVPVRSLTIGSMMDW